LFKSIVPFDGRGLSLCTLIKFEPAAVRSGSDHQQEQQMAGNRPMLKGRCTRHFRKLVCCANDHKKTALV